MNDTVIAFLSSSVLELHQNPAVEAPQKKINTKFDHLVLGPAAGQGLPNRLQCQGTKALNKTHMPSSSNAGESVAFVTVFTVYNTSLADSRLSNMVTVGNASYTKMERSMAVLNVFINFIQVTMPRSNVVILTDPASDLSLSRNSVTVYPIQGDYSRDKLMLQRIRSYITFLETRLGELALNPGHTSHYIFTDSDIAVVDDLGHLFNDHPNFHLALTFRNNKEQPLNSGFIAVRGTADAILSSKYMSASRMLGDQLALAWAVKSHPGFDMRRFTKAQAFLENIGGASVLFLPCATYNWTPPEGAGQFHGMPLDVKVVHFKGSRKRLMLESWDFLSSSSDIFDMLCLVLSSGRTKLSTNEISNPEGTNSASLAANATDGAWKDGNCKVAANFDFSTFH
ncbi:POLYPHOSPHATIDYLINOSITOL PHOSPHATASE [Salix purpurea]|uniref:POLYPHOSPHATIDYLINOSITOL PHOSPHATASE n=1 Tax=Salix purpurea TaxID=77065 RepID=A0A9Q0P0W7_SALPP|nr:POLYPHOSPHATIDYLINOSITOL PHOSPHATASE [Salix purpurea]